VLGSIDEYHVALVEWLTDFYAGTLHILLAGYIDLSVRQSLWGGPEINFPSLFGL
jgi:hypothetical protein